MTILGGRETALMSGSDAMDDEPNADVPMQAAQKQQTHSIGRRENSRIKNEKIKKKNRPTTKEFEPLTSRKITSNPCQSIPFLHFYQTHPPHQDRKTTSKLQSHQ